MKYELTDSDLLEFSKDKLRILQIPFDTIIRKGDHYMFCKDGVVFACIPILKFSDKQVSFFESIKEQIHENREERLQGDL